VLIQAEAIKRRLAQRLNVPLRNCNLNEFELALVPKMLMPNEIMETLDDVAGLGKVHEQLQQDIKFAKLFPTSSWSQVISPSKGILLYGPPGTGKTTIAKVWPHNVDTTGLLLASVREACPAPTTVPSTLARVTCRPLQRTSVPFC
jgi:Cdc6-like AAA superfamily ATPase